jgi:3-oxoacyl-[acyl-carrier protein] reductase
MKKAASNYLQSTFGLTGKRAVVTGAGKGIGRAIAEALAGAGAEVLVHYHSSRAGAEELVKKIEASGGTACSFGADLTDSKDAQNLFKHVEDRWGALNILVNNAGDLVQRVRLEQIDDALIDKVLRVNIHSTVYSIRAAAPLLHKGKDACVINLSSVAAHHGGGNGAVLYAAAKGAILTLTRGLAKEFAPDIRVNGIAPGVIMTDFHRTHSTQQMLDTMAQNTPLKRIGTAEECAAAVVFLAGSGASFITGETIEINGGLWLA